MRGAMRDAGHVVSSRKHAKRNSCNSKETSKREPQHEKRHEKKTLQEKRHARNLQKRPTKETCKRDLQTWPANSRVPTRLTQHEICHAPFRERGGRQEICQKRPTKLKRDLQKRPTNVTCKLLRSDATNMNYATNHAENAAPSGKYVKRDLHN